MKKKCEVANVSEKEAIWQNVLATDAFAYIYVVTLFTVAGQGALYNATGKNEPFIAKPTQACSNVDLVVLLKARNKGPDPQKGYAGVSTDTPSYPCFYLWH